MHPNEALSSDPNLPFSHPHQIIESKKDGNPTAVLDLPSAAAAAIVALCCCPWEH